MTKTSDLGGGNLTLAALKVKPLAAPLFNQEEGCLEELFKFRQRVYAKKKKKTEYDHVNRYENSMKSSNWLDFHALLLP